MTAAAEPGPVVIRVSPMAHFISGFTALSLLGFVPLLGNWVLGLMVLPVLLSLAVERLRTVADRDTVTARTLLGSRTVPWGEVDGLRFTRGGWARACLGGGGTTGPTENTEMTLPAVTFATLPRLAAASGGRVPNPYR